MLSGKNRCWRWVFCSGFMNTSKCLVCRRVTAKWGHSASVPVMALCPCNFNQDGGIISTAKHLEEFLAWLLSRQRQADIPGESSSCHRRSEPLRQLWSLSPVIDEIRDIIFVLGVHQGSNAVVLIAQAPDYVLGGCTTKTTQTNGSKVEAPPLTMRHNREVAHEFGAGRITCVATVLESVNLSDCLRSNSPDLAFQHDASIGGC